MSENIEPGPVAPDGAVQASPAWERPGVEPFPVAAHQPGPGLEQAVRRAWTWAAATVVLFPILLFWSLPAAASATLEASRGDAEATSRHGDRARLLGIAAIVVAVVFLVLWVLLLVAAANMDTETEVTRTTVYQMP